MKLSAGDGYPESETLKSSSVPEVKQRVLGFTFHFARSLVEER